MNLFIVLVAVLLLSEVVAIIRAPSGHEDEGGFHFDN